MMLTYAEYIHNNPLPVCNTMLPAPSKPVEVCPKAVRKATRIINEIGTAEPHPYSIAAHNRSLFLFSTLKGKGQLSIVEIATILGISRRGATLSAERLITSGELLITKVDKHCNLYEWADGATGSRKSSSRKPSSVEARFEWMREHGWLKFSDIAEKTGLSLTKVRDRISELAKNGLVAKAPCGKKNGGTFIHCRWIG